MTYGPEFLKHLEYDIEVLDSDDTSLLSARKLEVNPEDKQKSLEFRKNKDILLTIPISDIKELTTISGIRGKFGKEKESVVGIVLHSSPVLQNKRFINFDIKNRKHVDLIQQQIEFLKDAETNKSSQTSIKITLNPELCHTCLENTFSVEFNSKGKLCHNCFEKEYGKILLQTPRGETIEYNGGHRDYVLTGIFGKRAIGGIMYLTENYFVFATNNKDPSKRWEITMPLASIVLCQNREIEQRKKYSRWEATNPDSFGFGSGFTSPKKGFDSPMFPDRLLIPYTDKDNQIQEPEFSIPSQYIREWTINLFLMVIRAKVALRQQKGSEYNDRITEELRFANCFTCKRRFEVYNVTICDHCYTSFCDSCWKNHSMKPELDLYPMYLGGHKRYPKPSKNLIKLNIFSDRIEVGGFRIPYTSINGIENVEKSKISASRVVGLSLVSFDLATVGALWKKDHIYTIIQYTDGFNDEQVLIFDFRESLENAQRAIYDRMISFRHLKNQLSEVVEKQGVENLGSTKSEKNNPLHILKLRLAKGEITKEEYEETRKLLDS